MSTRADRVRLKKKELLRMAEKHKAERDAKKPVKKPAKNTVVKKPVAKPVVVAKNTGKLPLSGSEEQFTNLVWGSPEGIAGNNCYGYAMGVYRDGGYKKLQPGELAGTASIDDDLTKCDVLRKRTLEDLTSGREGRATHGYAVRPEEKCKAGHYKIMGFVSPKKDYHWYRQNGDMMIKANGKQTIDDIAAATGVAAGNVESPDDLPEKCDPVLVKKAGLWAHKRGLNELTVKDAGGDFIRDPRKANRDYGKLNYKTFCGSYCVKNEFGRQLPK
jgi:hypothetical protein